ncbi:MAG: MBL fold metallo-hydrolase [Candidatus Paceibacterota bacterium]|jgi:L-ascorbate metabolism protein UlaG (beta-lactamase superfamily)
MIITYLGKQFFKIQQGDLVIAFNPVSKDSKIGSKSKFGANIALVTTNHPDFNGADSLSYGETIPFIINGAGDYEIKGIFIKGIGTECILDDKKYINTIYSLVVDGISICFLGAISSKNISNEVIEAVGTPDVLFVPIGNKGVLDPMDAYKVSLNFEPKIIIPMDYGDDKQKDALKIFLKEGGSEKITSIDKLTLKRKDLEGKEADIVVLDY